VSVKTTVSVVKCIRDPRSLRALPGSTVKKTVAGFLAFPDTVSLHMPIISLARIAVHPLGLEVQERRDANSESYEESNQPVKDHPRLGIVPSP